MRLTEPRQILMDSRTGPHSNETLSPTSTVPFYTRDFLTPFFLAHASLTKQTHQRWWMTDRTPTTHVPTRSQLKRECAAPIPPHPEIQKKLIHPSHTQMIRRFEAIRTHAFLFKHGVFKQSFGARHCACCNRNNLSESYATTPNSQGSLFRKETPVNSF